MRGPRDQRQQSGRSQSRGQLEQSQEMWSSACENVGSTERIVSAGLGGLLVASGIFRGRLPGLLLTGLGASLLYRGLSGYCAMYQQMGINTCDVDQNHSGSSSMGGMSRGPLAGMMPHHDAIKA